MAEVNRRSLHNNEDNERYLFLDLKIGLTLLFLKVYSSLILMEVYWLTVCMTACSFSLLCEFMKQNHELYNYVRYDVMLSPC